MPSLIASIFPSPRLREVDRVAVASSPGDAWAFLRSTSPLGLPRVAVVAAACSTCERLVRAARRGAPTGDARLPQLVAGVACDDEFPWLDERPGREIVTGGVAPFWDPSAPLKTVTAAGFAAFDEPGCGKLAWSLQIDPREGGGSWIGMELRGDATDDDAWERLAAYWSRFEVRSRALRRAVARALVRRLGKPFPESAARLPGDEFVTSPLLSRTYAVTIEAPPSCVWPWLVQMGFRRAGWYSLDHAHNGGNRSLSAVRQELQSAKPGDLLATSARPGDVLAVLQLQPNRALVLGSPALLHAQKGASLVSAADLEEECMTWAFVLEPIGDAATRLVVRLRRDQEVNAVDAALRPLTLARHAIMQRTQLKNLKWRAEALARSNEILRGRTKTTRESEPCASAHALRAG